MQLFGSKQKRQTNQLQICFSSMLPLIRNKSHHQSNQPFRIIAQQILSVSNRAAEPEPGPGPRAPVLGILPGTGAGSHIKNQKEPELSLKFRTGAGAMAI